MAIMYGRPVLKAETHAAQPLNAAERQLAKIFMDAVGKLSGPNSALYGESLRQAIARGNIPAIVHSMNWTEFIDSFDGFRQDIATQIARTATGYSRQIGLNVSMASVDPNVALASQTQVGNLITHITADMRETVRRVVTTAVASQQLTVDDVASILRNVVGPTLRSANAIMRATTDHYNDLLKAGVPRAIAQQRALALGERMKRRAIRSRAITIARTEILRAHNAGRYLSWQAGAADGLVTPSHRKEWVATTRASRYGPPCEICTPLDGTIVAWDANFPGGYSMPPAHPRCRCTATLRGPEQKMTTEEWLAQQQNPPEPAPVVTPKRTRAQLLHEKWFDKPAPTAPEMPKKRKVDTEAIYRNWQKKVERRYQDFAHKPFSGSLNYPDFQKMMTTLDAEEAHRLRDRMIQQHYLDEKLAAEFDKLLDKALKKAATADRIFSSALKKYEASYRRYQSDLKNWRKVNGITARQLNGMEGALRHTSDHEGVSWANDNMPSAAEHRRPAQKYTRSADYGPWNEALRSSASDALPAGPWGEWTKRLDDDMAAMRIPQDVVLRRGTTWQEFMFADGSRGTYSIPPPDPLDLIGTVQVQRGYMSTSVGHTPGFSSKPVWINLRVPKGHGGIWIQPYSDHPTEREVLLQRNTRLYVHNVYEEDGKWKVDAEVIPADYTEEEIRLLQPIR